MTGLALEARIARAVRSNAKRRAKTRGHCHWPLALSIALLFALCSLPIPRKALAQGWLSGYDKRVKLMVDHNDITSNLINFPVLIYLSTASGRGAPQDDLSCVFDELGSDANRKKIAVTTSDGTSECYVEIERWDNANKKAWLWAKTPSLSSVTDTALYLYYDKDHADNTAYVGDTDSTPAESVWNTNYIAVYHLSQVPTSTIYDSTGNNKDLTPNNLDAADLVDAKIGKGINFDSSDTEYLWSAYTITLQAFTYELWDNPETHSNWEVLMNFDTGGVNYRYFAISDADGLGYDGEDGLEFFGSDVVTEDEWQYFCLTYNNTHMFAYRNSVELDWWSKTIQVRTDDFEVASYKLGTERHDGIMDEVRISSGARNADWLKASYESERDHFIDYESEESVPTTLLTYINKYVVTSTTAVQTSSTSLQNDTQASQTFSLTASQIVLVIYQANNLYGASMPGSGMRNAISVDGSDKAISWDSPYDPDYPTRNTVFWIGTLASGSHTIKGRFASGGGGTATVSNRVLLIYILDGDAFLYLDSSATSTTSSTSLVDDPAAYFTFTPPGSCKALILYNVANSGATESAGGKIVAIRVGSTDYSQAEKSPFSNDYPDSVFTLWALQLSASSTTVKGRFASSSGTISIHRRQLGILLFADSTLLDTVNSDIQVSTTSSALQNDSQATISRTTTESRELLVLAMGTKRSGTDSSSTGECYGIKVNTNDRANSRGCGVSSSSAVSVGIAYAENLAAGGQTIKGRFSNNQGTDTAKIDSRRIVALWLSTTPESQPTPNFAFVDGGSISISTSETTIATLSTSSFDSGNNFVMAVVQFEYSSAATTIAAGNLKLTRGGSTLMSNAYTLSIASSGVNRQKWYALMAFDAGVPANPTYDVRATAAATGINGEAKILAISSLMGSSTQGTSTAIGTSETTLATLSSSLPAGDNIVLAILESQNTVTSSRYLSALNLKRGSTLASAQYSVYHAASGTAAGAWQVQLIPYLDNGAPASAQYTVTATASNTGINGRTTIVAFSRGSLSAAYSDGGSVTIPDAETTINTLTTSFTSGYDVAVIASEQFDVSAASTRTIANGYNKLQQNNGATGQTTNEYYIRLPANAGNDDGKGFGLLNVYANVPASPEYEVKATSSSTGIDTFGESKMLALCKPPKVHEFPVGPTLVLTICFSIFYVIKRWERMS